MMHVSQRETMLLLLAAAAAIYGGTYFMLRNKVDQAADLGLKRQQLQAEITQSRRLIDSRARWEQEYRQISTNLPVFPADKKMEIHWLSLMDETASRHGVSILKRQNEPEQQNGEVYEMPIECRDWEAPLDGFVRFLFDLQSQGAMLNIRQLTIKPKEDKALRGRFQLYCAYIREGNPPAAVGKSTSGTVRTVNSSSRE
jgi:hypothetical protein